MLARFELGMFDPPERVRWAQIPYSREPVARSTIGWRAARRRTRSCC